MSQNKSIVSFIVCLAIPLAVGGLSSLLTRNAMADFGDMVKPPLAPPGFLFPIVWTILYILMGVACYMIYTSDSDIRSYAIAIYGIQLFFNFCWSLIFFRLELYWAALVWLLIMWTLIIFLIFIVKNISMIAMCCLLPYLLWTTFAAYLNGGIAYLN